MSNANPSFKENIELFLVKNIIVFTPSSALNISNLAPPDCLQLADPTFGKPGHIDVLIASTSTQKCCIMRHHELSRLMPGSLQDPILTMNSAGPSTTLED
ncbi:hypothetical protein TNCV_3376991 [Trichonephila clavipes]|nr:hypothetical protein TNCV_3376991 [Trichonephila clavipes]